MDAEDVAEPAQPARRITEPGNDDEPAAPLDSEQLIGRYVVQHFLAQGGMGVVYVARDPELGRRVALKLVRTQGGADGTMRQRLLREAQALAQLSHPNVISVYDVGVYDDRVFIAMELIDGISLRAYLSQPHAWRDKLDVLIAAGRGLAAAHAAGIVHRDFKPENVIVGNDGRVCVLDFGLARAAGDGQATEPSARGPLAPVGVAQDSVPTVTIVPMRDDVSRERLEAHLTGLGTVVGTPAYMSPEHHRGEPVTAASDQFSFCVAAWEALYGQRPYSSQAESLRVAKEQQAITAPPRNVRVPKRVRRLLLRGLAPSPAARHASMTDLLAALVRAETAPRRWALAAAAVAVVAVVAGAFLWRSPAPRQCSSAHAAASLRGAWEPAISTQLGAAFAATGRAHAAETATRVRAVLDRYRDEWTVMHVDSCRATHERGEQSAAMLDLRTHCLGLRREALRAVVAQLARAADGEVVDHSVQAALGLPAIADCANVTALGAVVPLPAVAERRAAVSEAQAKLEDVRALDATGQYAAALPGARAVVASARTLAYPPLLAEALHTLSSIEDDLGNLEDSARSARDGALAAGAAHDDSLIVQALIDVMWAHGRQAQYDEALALGTAVEATLARGAVALPRGAPVAARGGQPSELQIQRASYLATKGRLLSDQGKFPEATVALEQSLALREQVLGPDHWRLAAALNSLGEVLRSTGRYDEALARFERARKITEAALGAEHPNVGAILNNIGAVYEGQSKHELSKAMYEQSLRIDEATFGAEHPRVAISLMNLGALLDARGQPAEAIPYFERALAIHRRVSGDKHPDVAMSLHNLGLAELHLDQADAALPRFREALAILQAVLPAEHVNLSLPMMGIGEALIAQKRAGEAVGQFERALAIQVKVFGEDSVELAYVLQDLAKANLAAGRVAPAVIAAERMVALYAKHGGDPDNRALADFVLAQALWSAGADRRRARELAHHAREVLAASKDREDPQVRDALRELASWLGARGGAR